MSNWNKIFLDLGRLKQSKRKRVIFTAKEGIRDIKNIPSHLQTQGYYTSYKHLTITYVEGEKEVLTFKAIITT